MRCPFCESEDTQVKDSRPTEDNVAIRRRRVCTGCEARFTTFERIQLRELVVIKGDGRRQTFDRDKMLRSLKLSLQKRPVANEKIERVANGIVRELETSGDTDILSKVIGEHVMTSLAALDPVAYVRYASVYKDFREVADFNEFLEDLEDVCRRAKTG